MDAEQQRLDDDAGRNANWKRWGPYLAERQWGTVREDYSTDGGVWRHFPHEQARSRAYRWGEDGLLGICDRQGRLCFALALWNGRDGCLKERLFGLSGEEGNHGEDVKECYYYLDATPTHSYMRGLYKYPQAAFPYERLRAEALTRGLAQPEFELEDTGIFDDSRYFDVQVEYAKASPDDILVAITVANRGPAAAELHLLPTLWFRNTWSWGRSGEGYWPEPSLRRIEPGALLAEHASLGAFRLDIETHAQHGLPRLLFTDNETNHAALFGSPNRSPFVKDAFHARVVGGHLEACNPAERGTKSAAWWRLPLAAGSEATLRLRLRRASASPPPAFGDDFAAVFAQRRAEADAFHAARTPAGLDLAVTNVMRQARAGLLWSKQFYHYDVRTWSAGDPLQERSPQARARLRNREWQHLYNRDVISMPDKWEYPWYAAWDLAFHAVPLADLDPDFAKGQLLLVLREWYMHPNGQLPAYEFAFGDVNPPVHAWACWRVYKISGRRGQRDHVFLARAFHKLLLNFTWWVNRKDPDGHHLFSGGFLGLDNIGIFDRSQPLPDGGHLEQADGTSWMAFYCGTMLSIALELAAWDPSYEDIASKFLEHFVAIANAINTFGGTGLWDEQDGFYYDQIHVDDRRERIRLRSLVGVIPLLAVEVLEQETIDRLPGFAKRLHWFLDNVEHVRQHVSVADTATARGTLLLAIPSKERLVRVLQRLLDENEFLAAHGIRSLSRYHRDHPYRLALKGDVHEVSYSPGDSSTRMFGGNSNWRGPIWFPLNYLLLEALERYHHFFGDALRVEYPTGSGKRLTLQEVADDLDRRLTSLFVAGADGARPCHGGSPRYARDPHWRDLLLFHEFFNGDDGRGHGASHQTGWTALVTRCMEGLSRATDTG